MDRDELIKKLVKLAQLDIDAVYAYDEALENISHPTVHTKITEFKNDHVRHITDLGMEIRRLGGEAPEWTQDFKGYLIEGMTSLRDITGTAGALKAMRMNEKLTNKTYEEASTWILPPDIHALIQKNLADERRHIAYIQQAIEQEVWEEETSNA